ncbi:hypothetical protein OIU76_029104 [Salix suchowensis]|nr:hypothetical protein OIU76_029104 [Salix suchowensis]
MRKMARKTKYLFKNHRISFRFCNLMLMVFFFRTGIITHTNQYFVIEYSPDHLSIQKHRKTAHIFSVYTCTKVNHLHKTISLPAKKTIIKRWLLPGDDQLGPQQLKNMTVLSDSSACLNFSLLASIKTLESTEPEKRLACFDVDEQAESLRDLIALESHFDAWSFIP